MWANYHAVYKNMCGSDVLFLSAAEVYINTGRSIQQAMVTSGSLCDASMADVGATLIKLGNQMRSAVRSVHRLGVALDLE